MMRPEPESRVFADTLTPTTQRVRILVTAVGEKVPGGWIVWGFRIGKSSQRGVGGLPTPRQYLVKEA